MHQLEKKRSEPSDLLIMMSWKGCVTWRWDWDSARTHTDRSWTIICSKTSETCGWVWSKLQTSTSETLHRYTPNQVFTPFQTSNQPVLSPTHYWHNWPGYEKARETSKQGFFQICSLCTSQISSVTLQYMTTPVLLCCDGFY